MQVSLLIRMFKMVWWNHFEIIVLDVSDLYSPLSPISSSGHLGAISVLHECIVISRLWLYTQRVS